MTGRAPVWHPFTQHAIAPPPIEIAQASGARLQTADGRTLIDAISSWWVVTHGHGHPRIIEAMRTQAEKLDQVIFAGFTHAPAETLARGLLALAPKSLAHVFFSDSGSTSVEVALKMALGYWRNIGETRTRIIAFEHGYHGDTVGTMSAGARGVFNAAYEPLLFDVARMPFPREGHEHATLDALATLLAAQPAAAVLIEPMVLGAGGMMMYGADTLAAIARLARAHGALLIADEVMTGWGRTGPVFACEHAGVEPDILCTAKGLTGGSIPLATTLCSASIFDAHYSMDRAKTLFHSSSYTANPIACAAAVANLEIWSEEPVRDRIQSLTALQTDQIARLTNDHRFTNVRQLGTIAAADLKVADAGYLASAGPKLYESFIADGVLLRPLGNTIYVMPPYCISADELGRVYDAILNAAHAVA